MPLPATRNDGLRLQLSGSNVGGLRIAGTLPGVVVTAAAARNGPGEGLLALEPGNLLSWTAPTSGTAGNTQDVTAGGAFMVEDGTDASQWLSVQVYPDYLPTAAQAAIEFQDSFNNIGPADLPWFSSPSLQLSITEYQLANVTAQRVIGVRLWLDNIAAGEPNLSVSIDGVTYHQPTSFNDANVLIWPAINAGGTVNVWVKRSITTPAASNPSILNLLQWAWQGLT